jgi:hypothetical protein
VGGNSPEQPNNTAFVLQPPLVVPAGETASYSLSVTVSKNPQVTRRDEPVIYAGMVGANSSNSNGFLLALALLELFATGVGTTRRRRTLVALLMLLAFATAVGCDNGSVPSPPPATTGVISSAQTATQLQAITQAKGNAMGIGGLPMLMGTISRK